MRDLAKEKHTPVVEAVSDPPPKTGFGFLRMLAADGGILPAGFDLHRFKNYPEGPLDSAG